KRRGNSVLASETPHPQKALIEKKMSQRSVKTAINLAVSSESSARSWLLLEAIASAYSGLTLSESNTLLLRKYFVGKSIRLKGMKNRRFFASAPLHLSLDELATLYHLPNKKTSNVVN